MRRRVPPQSTAREMPPPADVDAHPQGASPFGVLDLVGNVWQWTDEFHDEHTRAAVLRGGSSYQPQTSHWYFPQAYRLDQHGKYLLMAPGKDRSGCIGFRCVVDALNGRPAWAALASPRLAVAGVAAESAERAPHRPDRRHPERRAAQHDYPDGVRVLKAVLESSPDVTGVAGLVVDAYPDGWPADPAAFDGARRWCGTLTASKSIRWSIRRAAPRLPH